MRDDDAQVKRLVALYEGLADGQLLQMAEQSEDLTDAARDAVAQVMQERGLLAAEAEEPVDAWAGEDASALRANERWVWTFSDAFQAGEAIRLLDRAGIEHRVVEKASAADPEQESRTLLGLMVIVEAQDYAATVELLRAEMGLFPLAEGDGGSLLSAMEGTVLLAMFDRAEALVAAEALGRAGISFWWRDGKKEVDELPDEDTVAIEVDAADAPAAQVLVEKRLAELG